MPAFNDKSIQGIIDKIHAELPCLGTVADKSIRGIIDRAIAGGQAVSDISIQGIIDVLSPFSCSYIPTFPPDSDIFGSGAAPAPQMDALVTHTTYYYPGFSGGGGGASVFYKGGNGGEAQPWQSGSTYPAPILGAISLSYGKGGRFGSGGGGGGPFSDKVIMGASVNFYARVVGQAGGKGGDGRVLITQPSGTTTYVSTSSFLAESTSIRVTGVAGGGGGASSGATHHGSHQYGSLGGGGGGGGAGIDATIPVVPGETITINVGAGGSGGPVVQPNPIDDPQNYTPTPPLYRKPGVAGSAGSPVLITGSVSGELLFLPGGGGGFADMQDGNALYSSGGSHDQSYGGSGGAISAIRVAPGTTGTKYGGGAGGRGGVWRLPFHPVGTTEFLNSEDGADFVSSTV